MSFNFMSVGLLESRLISSTVVSETIRNDNTEATYTLDASDFSNTQLFRVANNGDVIDFTWVTKANLDTIPDWPSNGARRIEIACDGNKTWTATNTSGAGITYSLGLAEKKWGTLWFKRASNGTYTVYFQGENASP